MSLSNRVSLDTDVVFLRSIFMFSTNTNNVPVSTNFIMAAGQYGQIGAVDTLRNIETYGVGYLPCTFSTLNGQMLSISSNVASSFVNSNQLFSVQNYLIDSISATNADLNAFSSYVVNELLPSTVSGITWTLSSLNSSFLGYVVGTTVTQTQLFSTTDGLILNTGNQISSYSTAVGGTITNLSNYFAANGVDAAAFSNLSTYVSSFAASTTNALISTGQNFVALSNYVRLTTASNSTYLANISATVSELIDEINILSSLSQDPAYVIGYQSTLSNVRFGSNISISSINSNYQFGVSTFTGPSIFMSTATFSSLSAATGFVDSFAATTISSAALLTSSIQAQQIALNTAASNYALDVGGSINFTGAIYNNGAIYPPAATPVNVIGTLSTAAAASVWFTSNINVSSINSNYQFRESTFTGPSLFMSTGTFSTLSVATGFINDFGAIGISTGQVVAGQLSSQQLYTSSIVANTVAAVAMAANSGYFVETMSTAIMQVSSVQAQQIALNTVGSNYALDVGGSINFTGTMYKNGVEYPAGGGGTVNVLGTLSTAAAANVWFNSNIMVSSINSNVFIANSTISSFNIEASTVRATRIAIGTVANPTNSNALFVYGQSYFRDVLRAGSNTDIGPAQNVLTVNSLPGNVGINCNVPVYSLDVNGIANINDEFAVGPTYGEILIAQKVLSDNRVGINNNAPAYNLDVGGDINFTGTMYKNGVEYPAGGGGTVNVLGTLSTAAAANTWFNSNIMVSSINSNYQFRESTFTGPSIFMSTATFSTLSVATGFISDFGAIGISTGQVVAGQLSSQQLFTSSIVANTVTANDGYFVNTLSSAAILTSSVRAQQIALNTVASNYALDVGGSINFTGSLYSNGTLYPPTAATVNVLGTLSTAAAANTWFNSNINISSINSGIYLSNGGLGIGTQPGIAPNGLTVVGLTTFNSNVAINSSLTVYGYIDGTPKSLLTAVDNTKNIGINVGVPTAGYDLDVNGIIYSRSTIIAFSSMSTAVMQVSSLQAQQATVAGTAIIGGTLTASNAATVGTTLGVGGAATMSNTLGVASATTLSNTLNVIGQATFSNTAVPVRMSNSGSANSIDFSLTGTTGTPYITLQSSDAATAQNYPMIAFSNSGTNQRYRLGLGNNSGAGTWTANQLTLYSRSNITEVISLGVGSNGFIGIGAAANASNTLLVSGKSHITGDLSVGTGNAGQNVLFVDDTTNNCVGINCNAPSSSNVLHVNGPAYVSSNFAVGSNTGANLLYVHDGSNSVGINTNTPNSAYVLDVNGVANFSSNISTTYTVQSQPRVWSYIMTSPVTAPGGISVLTTNYTATSQITSGSNYTVPYTGVYVISVTCGMSNQVAGSTQISLCNIINTGLYDSRIVSPAGYSACSLQYAGIITQNDILILYANSASGTNGIINISWTIQYLG